MSNGIAHTHRVRCCCCVGQGMHVFFLCSQRGEIPSMTACMGLCETFVAGVRKQPLIPIPAPIGPLLRGVWKGRIFSNRCGSVRQVRPKSHSQISRIWQVLRLDPKDGLPQKIGVTHGVENEAVPKQKTRCGRFRSLSRQWSCSDKSMKSTRTILGCSLHPRRERCTIRTPSSNSMRRSWRTRGWNISGFTICGIPSLPWHCRMEWTWKQSLLCWGTMTLASLFALTPTPPGRCRNRQRRRWETLWNEWCKEKAPERKTSPVLL